MKLGKMPVTGRNEDKQPDKLGTNLLEGAKSNDVASLERLIKVYMLCVIGQIPKTERHIDDKDGPDRV
jgi:hypothetical protein